MTKEDIKPIAIESTETVQTINSKEVAEMLDTEHKNLMRKIEGISKDLVQLNFELNQYWLESQYVASNRKSNRCYLITKKGCEFLAHKTTGTKGNIFTARYMDRFEQMEKALKVRAEPPRQELSDMEILSRAVLISNTKIQELTGQVEDLKPKADFAENFLTKPGDVSMDELAQILCSNGLIDYGVIKLFQWMRNNGYIKKRQGANVPTQRSLDLKIMRLAEKTSNIGRSMFMHLQARVTPKGVKYFIEKFKELQNE